MTDQLGDEMTDTTPPLARKTGKRAAGTLGTNRERVQQLANKTFWGNVLAGVVASVAFFVLTKVWDLLLGTSAQVFGGITAGAVVVMAAFLILLAVNVLQTARHTRDPKAMGKGAFLIWQVALGVVGVGMVILLLTLTSK